MLRFLLTMTIYLGVLLLCSLPVVLMARRDRYHQATGRKFLLAGLICGLVCGLVVATSNQLVERCENAGNTQCFDAGGTGLVTVVIIGFLVVSVVRAYMMASE